MCRMIISQSKAIGMEQACILISRLMISRDHEKGRVSINYYIKMLEKNHTKHIKNYGDRLEERLTGRYETSSIDEFSAGDGNRGSSIRIPKPVAIKGYGYIEDRRPGANADPYLVAALIISSIAEIEFDA